MDVKKIVIIFAVLLMVTGAAISILKWLKIGPFSEEAQKVEEVVVDPVPISIDMDRLTVPIFSEDRVAATVLIDFKIEAMGFENQEKITKLLPRINDAFFKDLYVFIPRVLRGQNKLSKNLLAKRMEHIGDKIVGDGVLHSVSITEVTER